MKTLLKYTDRKEKILIAVSIILIIIQVGLEVQIPVYMKEISNLLQTAGTTEHEIIDEGILMLLCAVAALAVAIFIGYIIARVGTSVEKNLREAVFARAMEFSLQEEGEIGSASLISRCTADITLVGEYVNSSYQYVFKAPFTAIFVLIMVFEEDIHWLLCCLGAVLLISAILAAVFLKILPKVPLLQRQRDIMTGYSREHVVGMRVIHAYNAFVHQHDRMLGQANNVLNLDLYYYQRYSVVHPSANAVLYGLSMAIYISGAFIIMDKAFSERSVIYADMIAFLSLGTLLISSFIYMASMMVNYPRAKVSIDRINEVINHDISIEDGEGKEPSDDNKGTIEFSHVSFRYPEGKEDVLKDISFTAKKGETIAIIGATGCGKTSLLNLIPRLYDTTEGTVKIDGVDVRDYKVGDLRGRIGYVPQRSYLFSKTIAENIGYGDNGRFKATLEQIHEAAKVGQAAEFIKMKEGGYDYEVSSGGSNFSGGQRQRLTISRAIARDPEIYLFDDSFSALDFKTDRTLRKKLKETTKDATIVIVAQRISTIRKADRILVLDNGSLVDSGTHDELMDRCEIYQEIALSQLQERSNG